MGKLKKGCILRKFKKSMDLLSFMCSFKCCKNFSLKKYFSESNFLEVYAVVHYMCGDVHEEVAKAYFLQEMEDFSVAATSNLIKQ